MSESRKRHALDDALRRYLSRLGRRGGLKGGPARARKLSAQQRREAAQKAARARWAKRRKRKAR